MDSTSVHFRSHTALLLAAALPFLQPAYRQPVELAMKFLELSETMKVYREIWTTESVSSHPMHSSIPLTPGLPGIMELINRYIQDPEGLLHNLSPVCTGKEKNIVDLLLNLLHAKSFYENYGDILNNFMSADGFNSSATAPSPPVPEPSFSEDCSTPDMASMMAGGDLSSMLTKDQQDTLSLLKNLLDAE